MTDDTEPAPEAAPLPKPSSEAKAGAGAGEDSKRKVNTTVLLIAVLLVVAAVVGVALVFWFVSSERQRDLQSWQVRMGIVADSGDIGAGNEIGLVVAVRIADNDLFRRLEHRSAFRREIGLVVAVRIADNDLFRRLEHRARPSRRRRRISSAPRGPTLSTFRRWLTAARRSASALPSTRRTTRPPLSTRPPVVSTPAGSTTTTPKCW